MHDIRDYVDADFAGNLDRRRSQTGYVFTVLGNSKSWKATFQHIVALSTIELEYIALTEAVKEAIWIKGIIGMFGRKVEAIPIHYDF